MKQKKPRLRKRWRVAAVAAVALSVFALGPRAHRGVADVVAARAAVPTDPRQLETWLAGREARYSDITRGAEKHVAWAGVAGERTPLALVYVHGFSATRQEVAPLVERLSTRLGANAFLTRLQGHGRPGPAMGEGSVAGWEEDVAEAVQVGRILGDRVVLLGCSTGATLAASYALSHPEEPVLGVVAISPNFGPRNSGAELLLWPWGSTVLPPILGERSWEPVNEAQARYWTTRYPSAALVPMMVAVDEARRADWSALRPPVLLVHDLDDPVVDPGRVETWARTLPKVDDVHVSDTLGDGHVLAGDILSPARTDGLVDRIATGIEGWRQP